MSDSMVQTFLAAVLGLAGFLSYKHYKSFLNIAIVLAVAAVLIPLTLSEWNNHIDKISSETRKSIQNATLKYDLLQSHSKQFKDSLEIELTLLGNREELAAVAYGSIQKHKVDISNGGLYLFIYVIVITVLLSSPFIIKEHPYNKVNTKTK